MTSGACQPREEGQIPLHQKCPPFTIEGRFDDYPTASVRQGSVLSIGHVVYEDDEWIVLRPKGTVQYELRKDRPGTTIIRHAPR
jgi:hypothetical protein